MANKIQVKLILELRSKHMSRNNIAQIRGMSRNSVSEVFRIADQMGITFEDVKDKNPESIYSMFFPDKHSIESLYAMPDYDHVHSELKRVRVTLKLLWEALFRLNMFFKTLLHSNTNSHLFFQYSTSYHHLPPSIPILSHF